MPYKNTLLLLIMTVVISGCASFKETPTYCAITGAVIVGVGAGVDEDDNAAAGALVGGAIGWLICQESDADRDGINDKNDACPRTPPGVSVDERGCPTDSDGDGVADHLDECSGTVRGASVDADGCALDSDKDRVVDHMDKCPGTPRGAMVDRNGCEKDSDGDGVTDGSDRCPNTAKGKAVNKVGCHTLISLTGLSFETASHDLSGSAMRKLDTVVQTLQKNPEIDVLIEGHTDSRGNEANNQQLSELRAKAVLNYLVSEGISAARLTSRGYGESDPVASNDTAEGQAQNRRVDFVVN